VHVCDSWLKESVDVHVTLVKRHSLHPCDVSQKTESASM
jgi:hypothetical protein